MRKIIQLVSAGQDVFALCNDGSVFLLTHISAPISYGYYEWDKVPNVPQPSIKKPVVKIKK